MQPTANLLLAPGHVHYEVVPVDQTALHFESFEQQQQQAIDEQAAAYEPYYSSVITGCHQEPSATAYAGGADGATGDALYACQEARSHSAISYDSGNETSSFNGNYYAPGAVDEATGGHYQYQAADAPVDYAAAASHNHTYAVPGAAETRDHYATAAGYYTPHPAHYAAHQEEDRGYATSSASSRAMSAYGSGSEAGSYANASYYAMDEASGGFGYQHGYGAPPSAGEAGADNYAVNYANYASGGEHMAPTIVGMPLDAEPAASTSRVSVKSEASTSSTSKSSSGRRRGGDAASTSRIDEESQESFGSSYGSHDADEESQASRDERRARALAIPIATADIINLPIDEFNEQLAKHELSEAQLSLIRDIRRRGKNKVAAQNCRKRKMDQIMGLQGEVEAMFATKAALEAQQAQLLALRQLARDKYAKLYNFVVEASSGRLGARAAHSFTDGSPPEFPDAGHGRDQETLDDAGDAHRFHIASVVTVGAGATNRTDGEVVAAY